jgi:hypothetical protein
LRLSGGLYALNNIPLIMRGVTSMRTNPERKSYLLKFLTAGTYIFGNAMLSISSKEASGHPNNKDGREAMTKLTEAAAHVVAAQPLEVQDALVHQISGFLAADPHVKLNAREITQLLSGRLSEKRLQLQAEGWQGRTQQSSSSSPTPTL